MSSSQNIHFSSITEPSTRYNELPLSFFEKQSEIDLRTQKIASENLFPFTPLKDGTISQRNLIGDVILEESNHKIYLSKPYPLNAEIVQEEEKINFSPEFQTDTIEQPERSKTALSPRSYMRQKRAYEKRILEEAKIIKEKKERKGFIPNEEEENTLREAIKLQNYQIKDRERRRNKRRSLSKKSIDLAQKVEKIRSKKTRTTQGTCNLKKDAETTSNTTKDTTLSHFPEPQPNIFLNAKDPVIDKLPDLNSESYPLLDPKEFYYPSSPFSSPLDEKDDIMAQWPSSEDEPSIFSSPLPIEQKTSYSSSLFSSSLDEKDDVVDQRLASEEKCFSFWPSSYSSMAQTTPSIPEFENTKEKTDDLKEFCRLIGERRLLNSTRALETKTASYFEKEPNFTCVKQSEVKDQQLKSSNRADNLQSIEQIEEIIEKLKTNKGLTQTEQHIICEIKKKKTIQFRKITQKKDSNKSSFIRKMEALDCLEREKKCKAYLLETGFIA